MNIDAMNEKNETVISREKAIYDAQARILSAWGHERGLVVNDRAQAIREAREALFQLDRAIQALPNS